MQRNQLTPQGSQLITLVKWTEPESYRIKRVLEHPGSDPEACNNAREDITPTLQAGVGVG